MFSGDIKLKQRRSNSLRLLRLVWSETKSKLFSLLFLDIKSFLIFKMFLLMFQGRMDPEPDPSFR